jgi:26S proteasome regulatory subunit N2
LIISFKSTPTAKCIDHYTKLQVESFQAKDASEKKTVDPRLEDIVNRMFQRCFDDKKFKQAIGIAIETRRLDMFEKSIVASTNVLETISYAYRVTLSLIQNRKFRNAILRLLVKVYSSFPNPDYVNLVQCLIYLDEPEQVANVLESLIQNNNSLMAYQLGLDLYESATQQFLLKVRNLLKALVTLNQQPMDTSESSGSGGGTASATSDLSSSEATFSAVKSEPVPAEETVAIAVKEESKISSELKSHVDKLLTILNGEITITANMQFLIKNNHSDLLILKTIKDAVRNSICHSATVICNSFMHCGTTSDQFLRLTKEKRKQRKCSVASEILSLYCLSLLFINK